MKRVLSLGAVAALALSGMVIGVTPALADDLRVTNGNDSGPGSLRDALAQADANPGSEIHIAEGLEIRPISTLISNEAVRIVAEGSGATIFASDVVVPTNWYEDYLISAANSFALVNVNLNLNRTETLRGAIGYDSYGGSFLFENSSITGVTKSSAIDVNSGTAPSKFQVLNSSFLGIGNPLYVYEGSTGLFEVSGNVFTGVNYFIDGKATRVHPGQQVIISDNEVEFFDNPDGYEVDANVRWTLPENGMHERPVVISGNHFLDHTTDGATVAIGGGVYGEMAAGTDTVFVENNTFERPLDSTATRPFLEFEESSYYKPGWAYVRNSTFFDPAGSSTVLVRAADPASRHVAFEHVTLHGGISVDIGEQVSILNSALSATGSVLSNGDSSLIQEAGNVITEANTSLPMALVVPGLQLGDLQDGGLGKSQVRIPSAGSPVINAGKGKVAATDQRGVARPQGSAPDAGAVEVREAVVAIGDAGEVAAGGTARFPVTVLQSGDTEFTVAVTTAGGNAVAGEDYTTTTQTLTFAAGATDPQYFEVPILSGAKTNKATFYAVATVTSGAAALESDSGVATILVKSPPKPEPGVDSNPDGTKKPLPNTGQNAQTRIWLLAGGLLLAGLGLALARRRSAQR